MKNVCSRNVFNVMTLNGIVSLFMKLIQNVEQEDNSDYPAN